MARLLLGLACAWPLTAGADEVEIVAAKIRCDAQRRCQLQVTLRHADSGWDHYANRWEVLSPDGAVLGTRVLRHPHVDEQPFTRGLRLRVPEGVSELRIRAYDSVHGQSPNEYTVELETSPVAPSDSEG